jgi:hypothetical protein
VRMNGSHSRRLRRPVNGDSVGPRWRNVGKRQVGIKADRPLPMVVWYGTPYAQALHAVERYRLLDYATASEVGGSGARPVSRRRITVPHTRRRSGVARASASASGTRAHCDAVALSRAPTSSTATRSFLLCPLYCLENQSRSAAPREPTTGQVISSDARNARSVARS